MKKLLNKQVVAFTSAILITGSFAGVALANHSWGGYHWARTSSPLTLKLGNNLTSNWASYLVAASNDWSASPTVLKTSVEIGAALRYRSSSKDCSPTAGRVEVCNKSYGNNGWLGIAQIWITGSTHITQGTVKVNDTYFNSFTYNNPNEKLHVVCQEVGHTFGLDHQSTNGSSLNTCMDYFSNTGINASSTLSTKPNAHDYEELAIIYAHLDSFNTIAHSVLGSGKLANVDKGDDEDGPSAWGKAVSRDARGRDSEFERDLGNGHKIHTFVTWTN